VKDTAVHFGWALPAHERHLQLWMANPKNAGHTLNGRQAYQGRKQELAMSFVTNRKVAVDVGGHVGFHSFNMAHAFEHVHAFEPVALHRKCFAANTAALSNITLHAVALGAKPGSVAMKTETGSSGNTTVGGAGDIPMITLDSLGLQDVGYMKLDCEGFEENVLRGAEATLKAFGPVVMVEQKRDMAAKLGLATMGAVTYLESLGYRVAREVSGDYIMVRA
jgi:FkbM family methyltransferase